jgi:hypothetical protein
VPDRTRKPRDVNITVICHREVTSG